MPQLDPDFASPAEWAALYREHGLQVVPAYMPRPNDPSFPWKRPMLAGWTHFQNNLTPDETFAAWYGDRGRFTAHQNMGLITGACSDNVFVIDLDTHSNPQAGDWWNAQVEINDPLGNGETWTQITGGGGTQLFFRAPRDWVAPTNRTPIGVDIRGQGGFAMLPPSLHSSGKCYRWAPGCAPWETDIQKAPPWLLDAVDALVEQYGGHKPELEEGHQRTPQPATDHDAWGKRVDGREDDMTRRVWAGVMAMKRAGVEMPGGPAEREYFERALMGYLNNTRTRLKGVDNIEGLERECRGPSLFLAKWQRAMRKWGTEQFEREAAKPPPKKSEITLPNFAQNIPKNIPDGTEVTTNESGTDLFEFLDVKQIKAMRDPEWLIDKLAVENALGFIFGAPGGGKTFVALSQALSLAVGMADWFGRPIKRTGPVVYISSEGQADLKFRIAAWETQNQVLADDAPFYLIRQTINFMSVDDVHKLTATIEAIKDRTNQVPVAVYVDTVSRVLPGADENLQKDMTLFIGACDLIRQRYGATVVGVHHTSRNGNGKMRGSTVFDGAGDFILQVEKGEEGEPGQLTAHKIKAARDGWTQPFRLEEVALPFGQSSLVAVPVEAPEAPKEEEKWLPERDTCNLILAAIQTAWLKKEPWSVEPITRRYGRYAPVLIHENFASVSVKAASRLLEKWMMNGVVKEEQVSSHSRKKGLVTLVNRL